MKKGIFFLAIFAGGMFFAIGNAFAPLVTVVGDSSSSSSSSSSSDSSVVDLSDKDTSQPVKLLR